MKTTTKIAAAVAVLGLVGVFALSSGVLAHGAQASGSGWQNMNGMMNNSGNGNQWSCYGQTGNPASNLNGSTGYCYTHNINCTYNAQTGAWDCPYGCVYHNQAQGAQVQGTQTQGATGQSSGHAGHCCW